MRNVKYPIGLKLILITTVLLLFSLGSLTFLVTYFMGQETQITAESNNYTINTRSAAAVENELTTLRANVMLLLDMLNSAGSAGALSRQATAFFFERNQNIASIVLRNQGEQTNQRFLINNRFFLSNELDIQSVNDFIDTNADIIERASLGETVILNAAPVFKYPILSMIFQWNEGGIEQAAVILFSSESLSANLGTGSTNVSFLINHQGDLLVHNDFNLVQAGTNYASLPLVQAMWENNDSSRQIMFSSTDGQQYFGAYNRLNLGDLGVITIIAADMVFEPIYANMLRNIYLTITILFLTVIFIYFFSKTITTPIRFLTAASNEIEQGHFLIELKPRTQDEIGLLTKRFVKMGQGLAERERLKDTFGRFINKDIAEKALRGELTLGGETKYVTIFFSDIRSFTAISEKLEPFEVVEFLNQYMTQMVQCVNKTGGVVDKFIGDAIMAVWGAPISAGSPAQDALNCVRAAMMMRSALIEFNKDRGGDKKPIIRIGCGINTGPVVAGQIGSNDRMEYTVIGDAVNFASRTESLNKPLGTDILITGNTYELIKDHIIAEQMPSVTVKGKEKPVHMYAVVNLRNAPDIKGTGSQGPQSIAQVRNMLGIPTPDFSKVNLDEEEKKYQIKG